MPYERPDVAATLAEMQSARTPQPPVSLAESSAALERRYANRPVLSGTPRPSPDDVYGDPASGVTIPTQGQRAPTSSVDDLPNPLDLINNAMRPDSTSARSYRAAAGLADPDYRGPVIGVDGPQPTPPSAVERAYQDPSRSLDVPQGPVITSEATRPRSSFGGVGPDDARDQQLRFDLLNAKERQGYREAAQAQDAYNRGATARADLRSAENDARISRWRAQNGADVVLASGGREYEQQRMAIIGQAAQDAQRVKELRGDVAAADASAPRANERNLTAEVVAGSEAINRSRITDGEAQQRVIVSETERQKLEQQRRLNTLGNVLATSKDPAERQRASDALLALMGRDKPEEYQVIHAAGGTRPDPNNPTGPALKSADSIVIFNRKKGTYESIQLGTNEPAQGGDPVAEAKAAVARGANKDQVNARLAAMGYKGI